MGTLFFDQKIQESIDFIKGHEPQEGYTVKFSGGKDSIVLLDLVKKAGVKYQAYYNQTTIDPPELTRFILRHYPEVKWIRPKRNFFQWLERVGLPTKTKRWCCTKLKHILLKGAKHVLLGVRSEESYKRARRGQINSNKETRTTDYYPIFFWTEAEIWEYIEQEKLPYPSLYDEGFSRLGCVICPFVCRPGVLELHKKRWPKFYDIFEQTVERFYERKREWFINHRVHSAKQLLDYWYHSEASTAAKEKIEKQLALFHKL
ncbi:MAG: phosphoadenosine phosphosulfate reductase family protein [Candidatus Methanofastidiosum sp.]|nr:phosphoadenosine phosphosulfate reductase family protein [Methanofastidiosum sp.]